MRQGWIFSVVALWLLIFTEETYMTGGGAIKSVSEIFNILTVSHFASSSNIIVSAWTIVTDVAPYFTALVLQVFLLWAPTVFAGGYIWLYLFPCFPVAVVMDFCLVAIARGVHMS